MRTYNFESVGQVDFEISWTQFSEKHSFQKNACQVQYCGNTDAGRRILQTTMTSLILGPHM